jgi:hypothetical protein
MKDFMLEEGVLESLISFLTRLDPSIDVTSLKVGFVDTRCLIHSSENVDTETSSYRGDRDCG